MATKLTKRQQTLQDALAVLKQPTSISEGVATLQSAVKSVAKFDETFELHIRLGINMKHADQQIRTTCVLPEGTGKTIRVAVIAKGEKVSEAQAAGAEVVGSEDLIDRIKNENFFDFDVLIATPDMMVALGKIGKLLGPKGLMPNPKTGTVTFDVAATVKRIKAGQVEVRPDKQGVLHIAVGKLNFTKEALLRNIFAVYDTVLRAKPAAAKGVYVKSIFLTSTMSPSVRIDPSVIANELKSATV
ncbi:MAG: 50S ribosomal protein L1 [Vampirovibrio sp.]|jgi:large subunit ribosomal protein L1|nr:50S ribosomal protein L1 [Vampirovibrio sp.]